MSKFVVYVEVEPYLKQWLTHSFGDPVEFPVNSNDLFRLNMWCDLGDLNDMPCKKMSAFRSWCVQQGIDIEFAETIRMKWYRMRKAYQEKGINLFNLKRCKKDDFSLKKLIYSSPVFVQHRTGANRCEQTRNFNSL